MDATYIGSTYTYIDVLVGVLTILEIVMHHFSNSCPSFSNDR